MLYLENLKDIINKEELSSNELASNRLFASKLVKMSAKQYAFTQLKPEPYKTTLRSLLSNTFGDIVLQGFQTEFGNNLDIGNDLKLYFSCDGIKINEDVLHIVEHKLISKDDDVNEYVINMAKNQLYLYSSLVNKCKFLKKSKFTNIVADDIDISHINKIMCTMIITTFENVYFYTFENNIVKDVLIYYSEKAYHIKDTYMTGNWDNIKAFSDKYKEKEQTMFGGLLTLKDLKVFI